jgi:hypothetical protein
VRLTIPNHRDTPPVVHGDRCIGLSRCVEQRGALFPSIAKVTPIISMLGVVPLEIVACHSLSVGPKRIYRQYEDEVF